MDISNLSDAELKTLVIKMLKELTEDLSIKKIQSEMKDTLIEINNNLQGINNRVDEAHNQINDNGTEGRKKQPVRTTKRKKEFKKMRIV